VNAIPATVDFVPIFEPSTVSAVIDHMNNDHPEDNLLIVRAFATADATAAVMSDVDDLGGTWTYEAGDATAELTVPWPAQITERAEIRREIVALYDTACARLGVEPRPH
jgi:hypothetical protein